VLSGILNRMVEERRSVVLDLGGGDRVLQEYGRDLLLVEFCEEYGIEPLALYFLGPEEEDLKHVLPIWEAGYFRPKRTFLVLNEGVIREGRTMAGAFGRALGDPGVADPARCPGGHGCDPARGGTDRAPLRFRDGDQITRAGTSRGIAETRLQAGRTCRPRFQLPTGEGSFLTFLSAHMRIDGPLSA
jgi:hypothetical protein